MIDLAKMPKGTKILASYRNRANAFGMMEMFHASEARGATRFNEDREIIEVLFPDFTITYETTTGFRGTTYHLILITQTKR